MTQKIIHDCIIQELQCCNCTWWKMIMAYGDQQFGVCENHKSDHCGHMISSEHQQCEYT